MVLSIQLEFTVSAMPPTGTDNDTGAPQQSLSQGRAIDTASQPRRSRRLQTAILDQQIDDTIALHATEPQAQASRHSLDNVEAAWPSLSHSRGDAHIHPQVRHSRRLRAMASREQISTLAAVPTDSSPAQSPEPLTQCTHSPPRASQKRRPSEPLHMSLRRPAVRQFHMSLRRPAVRQCTTQTSQPALMNAHIMESAGARQTGMSPRSSPGLAFDPG